MNTSMRQRGSQYADHTSIQCDTTPHRVDSGNLKRLVGMSVMRVWLPTGT